MPPKKKGAALYKDAMSYYKAAYRAHIKANTDWTTRQISSTLAWMWAHASEQEQQVSRDLRVSNAHTLPAIIEGTVPAEPKTREDPAPVRDEAPAVGAERDDGSDGEVGDAVDTGEAEPPAKKARFNTTAFPHWPDRMTINDPLPQDSASGDRDTLRQEWLRKDLLHSEKVREESQWHGVHVLGEGAAGRVGLWVKVNATKTIEERLAVRDVACEPIDWISPINWRDQLPREIAIQRRLNARNGHTHHIHRYYAHRISLWQRKYRVFNEVCDLGSLMDAMDWYSRAWRRRSNMFKWIEAHPELQTAMNDRDEGKGSDSAVARERRIAWKRLTRDARWLKKHPAQAAAEDASSPEAEEIRIDDEDFGEVTIPLPTPEKNAARDPAYGYVKDMSDIEDWHDDDIPLELHEVIPEAFIWTVFDQLIDAFIVMGTGGGGGAEYEEWHEIVHKDVHLQNILVKRFEGAHGVPLAGKIDGSDHSLVRFEEEEFPSVVLADFDQSFFDLQAEGDVYADNPAHYIWNSSPRNIPDVGGRYPPELYWEFKGHQSPGGWEKLTSKTDVWGVGQLMWNLVMNLPGKSGCFQQPFLDDDGNSGRELVDGTPYTDEHLDRLFSGRMPFEASASYSPRLRNTIRSCLAYRQADRPSFQELKRVTTKYAYGKRTPGGSEADGSLVVKVPGAMEKFGIGMVHAGKKRKRVAR